MAVEEKQPVGGIIGELFAPAIFGLRRTVAYRVVFIFDGEGHFTAAVFLDELIRIIIGISRGGGFVAVYGFGEQGSVAHGIRGIAPVSQSTRLFKSRGYISHHTEKVETLSLAKAMRNLSKMKVQKVKAEGMAPWLDHKLSCSSLPSGWRAPSLRFLSFALHRYIESGLRAPFRYRSFYSSCSASNTSGGCPFASPIAPGVPVPPYSLLLNLTSWTPPAPSRCVRGAY